MLETLKEQVVAVAKEAERLGMCRHKSGNFSIFDPETGYVVITPSGVARDVLGTEHVCVMDLWGKVIERAAEVKPSRGINCRMASSISVARCPSHRMLI